MSKIHVMQNNFFSPFLFILIIVLVLLSVVAIFYLSITAKSRERLALIDKGMNPNLARSDFWIQVGIIGGGTALGLMSGGWVNSSSGPLFAILFAGAGLVIYNIVYKARMKAKLEFDLPHQKNIICDCDFMRSLANNKAKLIT